MADRRQPAVFGLLRGLGALAAPALPMVLRARLRKGKEDPSRWREKLGYPGLPRPAGSLVWIHAASVGETNSIIGLAEALAVRGATLLLTTGTKTSAEIAAARLGRIALHQYAPLDVAPVVDRFLDHWRPDLALIVESEIWPTLFAGLHRRGVPFHILNAKLSLRAMRGWSRAGALARLIFGLPRSVLAQTGDDAARFAAMGVRDIRALGNLKFDARAPDADPATLAALRHACAGRPVWIAASTHEGEERLAGEVHRAWTGSGRLLTVIVPRHPHRGAVIAADLAAAGLTVARRAAGEPLTGDTDIYLADTLGELGLFYRLAPVVLIGGTFGDRGGQNPIEPALLGAAVLHGPRYANFIEIFGLLDGAGGAIEVDDGPALQAAVAGLLADEPRRSRIAEAGRAVVAGNAGALARTLDALRPDLAALGLASGGEGG